MSGFSKGRKTPAVGVRRLSAGFNFGTHTPVGFGYRLGREVVNICPAQGRCRIRKILPSETSCLCGLFRRGRVPSRMRSGVGARLVGCGCRCGRDLSLGLGYFLRKLRNFLSKPAFEVGELSQTTRKNKTIRGSTQAGTCHENIGEIAHGKSVHDEFGYEEVGHVAIGRDGLYSPQEMGPDSE